MLLLEGNNIISCGLLVVPSFVVLARLSEESANRVNLVSGYPGYLSLVRFVESTDVQVHGAVGGLLEC